ncbi:MAG: hypothetical protein LIP11_07215 [Clostridiales bacterium]|nr:hypothetical protein [Clostridiales bacterium]
MPQQLTEMKKRELETTLAAYIKYMEKNAESMRNGPMPEREKGNRCVSASVTMRENLITEYLPKIEEETIVIKGKEHACRITVEGLTGRIMAEEKSHTDHRGNRRTVYCLSWETPTGGCGERRCRFLVEPC